MERRERKKEKIGKDNKLMINEIPMPTAWNDYREKRIKN